MIENGSVFAVIIAGFSLIWQKMIEPGKVTGTKDGQTMYEGGGMLAHIGRKLSGKYLGDPLGLCPVCSSFWASLGAMACAILFFNYALLFAAYVVALTHLIIRILNK